MPKKKKRKTKSDTDIHKDNGFQGTWTEFNEPSEVACRYEPEKALKIIQLLYATHTSFPLILAQRPKIGTFQGRTQSSFMLGLTLRKWIGKAGVIRNTKQGQVRVERIKTPTYNEEKGEYETNIKIKELAKLLYRKTEQESDGLVGWFFPRSGAPVFCQVVDNDPTSPSTIERKKQINGAKFMMNFGYVGKAQLTDDNGLRSVMKFQLKQWCVNKPGERIELYNNYFKAHTTTLKNAKVWRNKSLNKAAYARYMKEAKKTTEMIKPEGFRGYVHNAVADGLVNATEILEILEKFCWNNKNSDMLDKNFVENMLQLVSDGFINPGSNYNLSGNDKLHDYLSGKGGVPPLDPDANQWLFEPTYQEHTWKFGKSEQQLILQELTLPKDEIAGFTLLGKQITLLPEDFDRFYLLPKNRGETSSIRRLIMPDNTDNDKKLGDSESKSETPEDVVMTDATSITPDGVLRVQNLKQIVCWSLGGAIETIKSGDKPQSLTLVDAVEKPSSIDPDLNLGTRLNWSIFKQATLRDGYNKFGDNPSLQNLVPTSSKKEQTKGNKYNPTMYYRKPHTEDKNKEHNKMGQMCAVCGHKLIFKGKIKKNDKWPEFLNLKTSQAYDVDHIANLIYNTLFHLNHTASGFLNTHSDCNQFFKGEKLWCPSYEVWYELIEKYVNNLNPEVRLQTWNKLKRCYPWPGSAAPGIFTPPPGGYQLYCIKNFHDKKNERDYLRKNKQSWQGKQDQDTTYREGQGYIQHSDEFWDERDRVNPLSVEAVVLDRFARLLDEPNFDDNSDIAFDTEDEAERFAFVTQIINREITDRKICSDAGGETTIVEAYNKLMSIYPTIASFYEALEIERDNLLKGNIAQNLTDLILEPGQVVKNLQAEIRAGAKVEQELQHAKDMLDISERTEQYAADQQQGWTGTSLPGGNVFRGLSKYEKQYTTMPDFIKYWKDKLQQKGMKKDGDGEQLMIQEKMSGHDASVSSSVVQPPTIVDNTQVTKEVEYWNNMLSRIQVELLVQKYTTAKNILQNLYDKIKEPVTSAAIWEEINDINKERIEKRAIRNQHLDKFLLQKDEPLNNALTLFKNMKSKVKRPSPSLRLETLFNDVENIEKALINLEKLSITPREGDDESVLLAKQILKVGLLALGTTSFRPEYTPPEALANARKMSRAEIWPLTKEITKLSEEREKEQKQYEVKLQGANIVNMLEKQSIVLRVLDMITTKRLEEMKQKEEETIGSRKRREQQMSEKHEAALERASQEAYSQTDNDSQVIFEKSSEEEPIKGLSGIEEEGEEEESLDDAGGDLPSLVKPPVETFLKSSDTPAWFPPSPHSSPGKSGYDGDQSSPLSSPGSASKKLDNSLSCLVPTLTDEQKTGIDGDATKVLAMRYALISGVFDDEIQNIDMQPPIDFDSDNYTVQMVVIDTANGNNVEKDVVLPIDLWNQECNHNFPEKPQLPDKGCFYRYLAEVGNPKRYENPWMIEEYANEGKHPLHWWSYVLVLASLKTLCSFADWTLTENQLSDSSIGYKITNKDDTVKLENNGTNHWSVWTKNRNGDTSTWEREYYRNGGDCGPEGVVIAINFVSNNHRRGLKFSSGDDMDLDQGGGKRTRRKKKRKKKTRKKRRKYLKKTKKRKRRRKNKTRRI